MIRDDPNWHLDRPRREIWSPFVKRSDRQLLLGQSDKVTDQGKVNHREAADVIESDAADDDASNWFLRSLGGAGAAYPWILRGHNPHTQRNLNSEPLGHNPRDS